MFGRLVVTVLPGDLQFNDLVGGYPQNYG